ncbi:hypothetical protein [Bradyrhizobium ottawaense]
MPPFRVAILALVVVSASGASAETIQTPRSSQERGYAPDVTARAQTASAAARGAAQLSAWLNNLGLSKSIDRSLEEKNKTIRSLLDTTGQPGVLVYVPIAKLDTEITRYELAGGSVEVVGAGTSPDDVFFGWMQNDRLSAKRQPDLDTSYFLWFKPVGKDVQVSSTPARALTYQATQRLADAKLRDTLTSTADGRALGLAVDYMERTATSVDLKKRIAELKAKQAETNQRAERIQADLQRELERERKAAVVANQLATIATVFTVASQVGSAMAYLGNDTPPSVANAKTPQELKDGVNGMLSEAIKNKQSLEVQYKSTVNQNTGTRIQYLEILTTGKYPLNDVPQIRN